MNWPFCIKARVDLNQQLDGITKVGIHFILKALYKKKISII